MRGTSKGIQILKNNGYVVYSREWDPYITDKYWINLRENKEKELMDNYASYSRKKRTYENVADALQVMGDNERDREIKILRATLGVTIDRDDEPELIRQLNKLMVGEKNYEQALKQLTYAAENVEKDPKSHMAPTLSSLFSSHLTTRMGNAIKNYRSTTLTKALTNPNVNQKELWSKNGKVATDLRKMFEKEILGAWEDIFQKTDVVEDAYGSYLDSNKDLLSTFNKLKMDKELLQRVKSRINIDEIFKVLKDEYTVSKAVEKKKKKTSRQIFLEGAKIESSGYQLNGSVNEVLNMLKQAFERERIVIDRKGRQGTFSKVSKVMKNEIQETDVAMLISCRYDTKELNEMLEYMDKKMEGTKDLLEAHKKMDDFYDEYLKDMKDVFVIYTSNKAYAFHSFSEYGFHGNTRKIDDLAPFLVKTNHMTLKNAKNFLDVVKSTIPEAALYKYQSELKEQLYLQVYNAMAYLLFDDWKRIGTTKGRAMHVFTLDDVNVPLSSLLLGAAKAMRQAESYKQWFTMSISYPQGVKYKPYRVDPENYPMKDNGHGKMVPAPEEAWEQQKKEAAASITVSTVFLKNFYTAIVTQLAKKGN